MIKSGLAAAGLILAAGQAASETLQLFYTEPLEGVYSQDWLGQVIGPDGPDTVLVFVRGAGKSGDFDGVLSVNCSAPQRSSWRAAGGFLEPDDVPGPAIDAIYAAACRAP